MGKRLKKANETLRDAIQRDPELAWAWHCNIAVPFMDAGDASWCEANAGAARVMEHLFGAGLKDYDPGHTAEDMLEQTLPSPTGIPPIVPDDLERAVDPDADTQYYRFPSTTVTVCAVPMRNGHWVIGQSASLNSANFNPVAGRRAARRDAMRKVWELLAYAARERAHVGRVAREEERGGLSGAL